MSLMIYCIHYIDYENHYGSHFEAYFRTKSIYKSLWMHSIQHQSSKLFVIIMLLNRKKTCTWKSSKTIENEHACVKHGMWTRVDGTNKCRKWKAKLCDLMFMWCLCLMHKHHSSIIMMMMMMTITIIIIIILGNGTWIWARWSYLTQRSPWCKVGFIAYLAVGGLLIFFVKYREDFTTGNWTANPSV